MTGTKHKLLIANRGEIAVRIIRTAKKLGIPVVAIYTFIDADTPHVSLADEAYPIGDGNDNQGYLNIEAILDIAKTCGATMIAPGYGFLSENSSFVTAVEAAGIIFLGPTPHQMTSMGLKHEARAVAIKAGVPVVPGSDGPVDTIEVAIVAAEKIGYPVMLKASAGGGGMGMTVCKSREELQSSFDATRSKGATLFKNSTVFLEKYISRARHVEVQIFGNGQGHVIHFGERECSVQRRHQKVIEESPCPLFESEKGKQTRERMCASAVRLGEIMSYRSAGTVEFVLDDDSPNYDFYFLELNARIQVEHAVTEVVRPGLDLVELMVRQGMSNAQSLPAKDLPQAHHAKFSGHSIEARVYCENPKADFRPSPGRLHHVEWADIGERGRIDTWVKTGTLVTPTYDPMIAKLVTWGEDRDSAIKQLKKVLKNSKVAGPITNVDFLYHILEAKDFAAGRVTTTWLDTMPYSPSLIEVISPGLSTSIQDLPGRDVGSGIPRAGPADMLSFQLGNHLVGNDLNLEGLEMTMTGAKILFHASAVIAVTGAEMKVTIDKKPAEMWKAIKIEKGSVINIGAANDLGLRCYLAIKGGFPTIAKYLNSKSTFPGAGLGGYQGRSLFAGDMLEIAETAGEQYTERSISLAVRPRLDTTWEVEVTPSAQWDPEFITVEGMKEIFQTEFVASSSSNRLGLRLEGPVLKWARKDGGEGGAHPSNILDQGYAFGALNMNGDTPVLFGVDGPDMGGFVNILSVAKASMWKLGQIRPKDKIRFILITANDANKMGTSQQQWIKQVISGTTSVSWSPSAKAGVDIHEELVTSSTIYQDDKFRISLAGDEFILFELGPITLDLTVRMQVELWERALRERKLDGIIYFNTCIRSSLVHFDPSRLKLEDLVKEMKDVTKQVEDTTDIELPITTFRMPVVPDDPWTKEATEYYMKTSRKEAVYLPNNGAYVARNNGRGPNAVRDALLKTNWLVIAQGFFLYLPFVIPLDPRHRLQAQKYNPSRIRTPEGALCTAGTIGSIHPIETPGGYQMIARTLSTFLPWAENPGEIKNFDQIKFYEVSPEEFESIYRGHKSGRYKVTSKSGVFRMRDYLDWVEDMKDEVDAFKQKQKECAAIIAKEEAESFGRWMKEKEAEAKATAERESQGGAAVVQAGTPVTAPLSASVWKFYVKEGDVIKDDDQKIVELEAMKTSVWVLPGDDTAGKRVKSIVAKEGEAVGPGAVLLYLE